jgi:hypothetical protein
MNDLDLLRHEFNSDREIGPQLYELLWRIVRAIASQYPPAIYSQSGSWDEPTLRDLLHDWIAQRLLRGDLEILLNSAPDQRRLEAQLVTSLRQLLINGRRRDSALNLYKRTLAMLQDDVDFEPMDTATAPIRQWRLVGTDHTHPAAATLKDLVRIAYELSDEDLAVERWGSHSLKSSPILRQNQLQRFLMHLFGKADGTLNAIRIADVMQHRFSLARQRLVELPETLSANDPPVDLRIAAGDVAQSILSTLRPQDHEALLALQNADWVVSRAAEALGSSEGRVSGARDRLAARISDYADDEQEAREILRIVLESLFQ